MCRTRPWSSKRCAAPVGLSVTNAAWTYPQGMDQGMALPARTPRQSPESVTCAQQPGSSTCHLSIVKLMSSLVERLRSVTHLKILV